MSVQRKTLTPAEYLALERQSEGKSEYYAGEVSAMTGASRQHNLIVTNVVTSLSTHKRNLGWSNTRGSQMIAGCSGKLLASKTRSEWRPFV